MNSYTNYWNGNGKYQDKFNVLSELMPDYGASETVAGELMRAANRLAYDFYNNGMGNNTSGAVNFLKIHKAINYSTYSTIYDYTRGQCYSGSYTDDMLSLAITSMIDQTIEYIENNPSLLTAKNTDDIFNHSEEDLHYCSECGDELDASCWSDICCSCEDELDRYDEFEDEEDYDE